MLSDDLQVVPGSFAAPLHLGQIVLQLVKVHLRKEGQIYSYKSNYNSGVFIFKSCANLLLRPSSVFL